MTLVPLLSMASLSDRQIRLNPLIVIVGPTAVGKSRLAVDIAKRFETEILTADSRQVYRGMDIGTDKPPLESRQGISHRLIDLVRPDESFNAGLYRRHAVDAIERLYRERRLPLVVGGTGLYVRTLLEGLCGAPPSDRELRARLVEEARKMGPDRLYTRLLEVDPATASRLHPHDSSKVIRALEVYHLSGQPMSEFQQAHGFTERSFSSLVIGLNRERHSLYRRIEERIDGQLAGGLVEETKRLLEQGYQRDSGAMKGLGYRHVAAFLAGDYDRVEMIRRFKRDTRRFAKRQMTWFNREPAIDWIMIKESESIQDTADCITSKIDRFLASLNTD